MVAYISQLVPLYCRDELNKSTNNVSCASKNTGNYIFHNAIMKIFRPVLYNYTFKKDRKLCCEANEDFFLTSDFIWIIENESLQRKTFFHILKHLLKRKNKIVIPLSVGLQTLFYKSDFQFHPDTIRILHEIADTITIPCRGAYTAEILSKNGIKNTIILGCPSIYTPMDTLFQINKPVNLNQNAQISINISPHIGYRTPLESFMAFYQYILNNDFNIIGQAANELQDSLYLLKVLGINEVSIEKKIIEKYKFFYNCDDWNNEFQNVDFTFGSRFHGNIMSVLNGKPALFLKIDSRMDEMCTFLNLPAIEFSYLQKKINVDMLYALADYTKFNNGYANLLENFINFFQKLGIPLYGFSSITHE